MIYLDNAATTFPKPKEVYDSMDSFIRNKCVNAGRGSYTAAKEATELMDETRNLLVNLVHADNRYETIFMPSATIAINQILHGLNWNEIRNVFVTPFEHNAIMRTLYKLKKNYRFEVTIIPFDNETFELNKQATELLFTKKKPELVLMSHVSNVLGLVLPINYITEVTKKNNPNAYVVIDASQSLGVVDLNVNNCDCDFIVFAGHKSLYGPLGIGGFIKKKNIELDTFITGGTGSESTNLEMPLESYSRYEAGSSNVYAICGLNAGIKWINKIGINNIYYRKRILTDYLVNNLKEVNGLRIYLPNDLNKHLGVVAFNVDGFSSSDIGIILNDDFDIAVRTGHHCAPFVTTFLDGKKINNLEEINEFGDGTIRVSIGYFNSKNDIDKLVDALNDILEN